LHGIFYEQVPCFQYFSRIRPDRKRRNPLIPDILAILIRNLFIWIAARPSRSRKAEARTPALH
jgi:hypothetical protein